MLLPQNSSVPRVLIDRNNLSKSASQQARDQILANQTSSPSHNYLSHFSSGELRRQC
jgi:hypothetical protein